MKKKPRTSSDDPNTQRQRENPMLVILRGRRPSVDGEWNKNAEVFCTLNKKRKKQKTRQTEAQKNTAGTCTTTS
jgi:hypothetical protein